MNENDNLLDNIIGQAINDRASDIHIEPEKDGITIRFRIDGLLHQHKIINKMYQDILINKIKVSSQMNISDHRLPQDGHLDFLYKNVPYNIRISSLPSLYGETIVMRILNRTDMLMRLDSLGMDTDQLELVNKIIHSPSGMILITGPTGSGKSNFMYSILHSLNNLSKNIVTLEDPVEYEIVGINQSQINEGIDFSFSKALRSVVRQDPDIIMVGEIRDAITAQLTVQASLIGMLVISTFHTFDVPALITRFFEMGISNSIVAQSVQAVVSTRLVRVICNNCKVGYTPDKMEQKKLESPVEKLYKGTGCTACKNSGYLGRTGIFDVVYFNNELKTSIVEKRPVTYIQEILNKKNTKSLLQSGLSKVREGITTLEEIDRVLGVIM